MVHPIDDSGCFTKEVELLNDLLHCLMVRLYNRRFCKKDQVKPSSIPFQSFCVQVPDFMGQHVKAADKDIKAKCCIASW